MKNLILHIMSAILFLSATAMADVKIKSRQTMSGQTTENTTYIKGKRQRLEMMNGMMISVTQCDLGRDLQINTGTKTYMINYYDDGTTAPATGQAGESTPVTKGGTMYVTTTIKDTGERKQMFGFTARHIIQTIETETSADACYPSKTKLEMDMWVIDTEFGVQCTQTRQYRPATNGARSGGCLDKVVPKTIGSAKSGYPLWQKMTSFDASGKESYSMIQEVVEMSKPTLDASLFDAPADYREVKDASQLYAGGSGLSSPYGSDTSGSSTSITSSSALGASLKTAAAPRNGGVSTPIGPKKPGMIRLGVAGVKTGAIGEGINAADLSAAIQNSFGEFLKGTKVEVVSLEAKLTDALTAEAKEKECDYIILATASHKKGGGGFGGFGDFGKVLARTVGQTGIGHTGSTAGNVAGQVATNAIVSAGTVSGNVRSKDEMTLDVAVQSPLDNSSPLTKKFKAKARSDGDDIVSALVEQAAQAIIDAVGK